MSNIDRVYLVYAVDTAAYEAAGDVLISAHASAETARVCRADCEDAFSKFARRRVRWEQDDTGSVPMPRRPKLLVRALDFMTHMTFRVDIVEVKP